MIIGSGDADPNGHDSGQSYVVSGGPGVGASGVIELARLDGSNGFALNGIAARDFSGWSASGAGDVNDDGIDDLTIGAWGADPNGDRSGQSYVIFGRSAAASTVIDIASLPDINGNRSPEFAALRRLPDGRAAIRVTDSDTGALIRTLPVDTLPSSPTGEIKVPLGVTGLADLNGNGTPEIAVLRTLTDGTPQILVTDGDTNELIQTIDWARPKPVATGITGLPDIDGNGSPEVAMLQVNPPAVLMLTTKARGTHQGRWPRATR